MRHQPLHMIDMIPEQSPEPPDIESLPPLMTPTDIAAAMGVLVDNARMMGNRGKFGKATEINSRKHYKREEVVRYWHERHTPETREIKRREQPEQPDSSANIIAQSVMALVQTLESKDKLNSDLAETVRMQQERIRELEAKIDAANSKQSWIARLFKMT